MIGNPNEEPMKYLTFIRHSESYRESPLPPALMEAMGKFVEELKKGTLVDTGGLLPCRRSSSSWRGPKWATLR